jgi:RNA polymerase sigma-70 factor (ECF subfamily)
LKKELLYDEGLLLQQLAKHDINAFTAVYDKFYPLVFYYTKKKIEDVERANEITADCFIKFWKGGKKEFDSLEGVKAYLLRSANNACINSQRDLQTQLAHEKEIVYYLQTEGDRLSEEDEYRAALMAIVIKEIEKLPKKCRRIFTMSYFEEKKNEEIAKELNLTEKTVRNQKHRALNLLRMALMEKKLGICIVLLLSKFLD